MPAKLARQLSPRRQLAQSNVFIAEDQKLRRGVRITTKFTELREEICPPEPEAPAPTATADGADQPNRAAAGQDARPRPRADREFGQNPAPGQGEAGEESPEGRPDDAAKSRLAPGSPPRSSLQTAAAEDRLIELTTTTSASATMSASVSISRMSSEDRLIQLLTIPKQAGVGTKVAEDMPLAWPPRACDSMAVAVIDAKAKAESEKAPASQPSASGGSAQQPQPHVSQDSIDSIESDDADNELGSWQSPAECALGIDTATTEDMQEKEDGTQWLARLHGPVGWVLEVTDRSIDLGRSTPEMLTLFGPLECRRVSRCVIRKRNREKHCDGH